MYYVTEKSRSKHQHKNQHGMKNTTASSTKAPLGVPPPWPTLILSFPLYVTTILSF